MREALDMSGHDYNNVLSVTTAGYIRIPLIASTMAN